jgi:hypothetical protein
MNKTLNLCIGVVTGEMQPSGYGPRPVVRFNRSMPDFQNNGWNDWRAVDFRVCLIEGELPAERNDLRDMDEETRAWRGWQGWIFARFNNGDAHLFICPHHESYDKVLRKFTGNIYSVQG